MRFENENLPKAILFLFDATIFAFSKLLQITYSRVATLHFSNKHLQYTGTVQYRACMRFSFEPYRTFYRLSSLNKSFLNFKTFFKTVFFFFFKASMFSVKTKRSDPDPWFLFLRSDKKSEREGFAKKEKCIWLILISQNKYVI